MLCCRRISVSQQFQKRILFFLCFVSLLSLIGYQFITNEYQLEQKRHKMCGETPRNPRIEGKTIPEETLLTLMTCHCDYVLPDDVTIEVGGIFGKKGLSLEEYKVFQGKRFVEKYGRMRGRKVSSLPYYDVRFWRYLYVLNWLENKIPRLASKLLLGFGWLCPDFVVIFCKT